MKTVKLVACTFVLLAGVMLGSIDAAADSATVKGSSPQTLGKDIDKKVVFLNEYLKLDAIQDAIALSNQRNESITEAEILALDNKWRTARGITDFIKPYLVNPCSKKLLNLQDEDEDFLEVFITDLKGLNVCQTNKTSDLYQADEKWWQNCFSEGEGKLQYGDIEYDESAGTKAASAHIPIYRDKQLIGVAKAVIAIASTKNN